MKQRVARAEATDWSAVERVRHEALGPGTVIAREGEGAEAVLDVHFDGNGRRIVYAVQVDVAT